MLKRKSFLSVLLVMIIISNTGTFAEELILDESMPEAEMDLFDSSLSIPNREASSWALDELVDSDRYGLYKSEKLYKSSLKLELEDEFKNDLLKNFQEKLGKTELELIERPEYLVQTNDSNTRGNFLREVYNIMVLYESEEKLDKDSIMYLNHIGILIGDGEELFLDRTITTEEGIIFIKRAVDYIYSENNLDTKGLMWKVENKDNTVYLLGSIHYGITELYPFRKEVLNNFDDSEILFVEVDITNQDEIMLIMMKKMEELESEMEKQSRYEDGTLLKDILDEVTYSKIEKIMEKHNISESEYIDYKISGITDKISEIFLNEFFGEDMEDFEEEIDEELQKQFEEDMQKEMEKLMENDFIKLMIEGPKLGIDFYFIDKAKTLDIEIGELESLESQMDLIFGGGLYGEMEEASLEEEMKILRDMLEIFDDEGNILEIEDMDYEEDYEEDELLQKEFEEELERMLQEQAEIIQEMFQAIKIGDAEKLAEMFIESEGEDVLSGQLIGERDRQMAEKISELLQGDEEKTYFIVVGAAHFVVDETIIDNLTNEGYEVERIE